MRIIITNLIETQYHTEQQYTICSHSEINYVYMILTNNSPPLFSDCSKYIRKMLSPEILLYGIKSAIKPKIQDMINNVIFMRIMF